MPNAAHVARAEPLRSDVERALSDHFGRPVALRLHPDDDGPPAAGATGSRPRPAAPSAPAWEPRDDDGLDDADDFAALTDLADEDPSRPATGPLPPSGLAWAEGRLLEAFPGAEEV